MTRRLVDLSHVLHHGLETYPGLPTPEICDFLSREVSRTKYAPGTEFQIGKITMVANTGTYVDAPFHRYADGKDLSELHLESLADLDAVVVRVPVGAAFVGIDSLDIDDISGGERPVHSTLLANEIPIGEHLTGLDAIPDRGARFFAVPVKVRAFGTFPVRALAIV